MKSGTAIFIILFSLLSCRKDAPPEDHFTAAQNFNRTIRFNVINVYSISPEKDSVVTGAEINIYSDYNDLVLGNYPSASRITDSLGYAEINGLDKDYYYIYASHPDLGEIIDSVSTSYGTISYVELLFYH